MGATVGFVEQLLQMRRRRLRALRGLGVDAEPRVDAGLAPDGIPVIGRVDAGIAEDVGAGLHALLELDGKADERGDEEDRGLTRPA